MARTEYLAGTGNDQEGRELLSIIESYFSVSMRKARNLGKNSKMPLTMTNSNSSRFSTSAFAADVHFGLSSRPKSIPSKYFYDERGSKLFEKICRQPEYYLTRVESEILKKFAPDIIKQLDQNHVNIIELGSGTSVKTRILFRELLSDSGSHGKNQVRYFPIDISSSALQEMTNMLSGDFANLEIKEIISDYESGLELACRLVRSNDEGSKPHPTYKMVLFLGSSVGNLEPEQCRKFFEMVREKMYAGDSLLVGFDLEKDSKTLEAAYNDPRGVTAEFNLNVLKRINRELGGNFDLSAYRHYSTFNRNEHRIEMHLISKNEQKIRIAALPDTQYHIAADESIHTENSYKYTIEGIEHLASQTGFSVQEHYTDGKDWFDLCLLRPC